MRRIAAAVLGVLLATGGLGGQSVAPPPNDQVVSLDLKGPGVKVVTVVDAVPFTVHAPGGALLYFWQLPPGVVATDMGDKIEVTEAPSSGTISIAVKFVLVDWDAKKTTTSFGRVTFAVGGITPPKPPTPPAPEPSASPFAEAGMRVLISFDPTILRPVGERWMYGPSKSIRDKLNAMCVPGPADEKDGSGQIQREWRIWPATENGQPTDVSLARKVFKDAWNNKGPEKRDWILIGDGKVGYSGPLPKPEAEVLALLAKFGGK